MNPPDERLEKIQNELGRLSSLLVESITEGRMNTTHLKDMVQQHSRELWGEHNDPGIKMKVDRLLQNEEQRMWAFRVIGGGLLALVTERIYHFFKA